MVVKLSGDGGGTWAVFCCSHLEDAEDIWQPVLVLIHRTCCPHHPPTPRQSTLLMWHADVSY